MPIDVEFEVQATGKERLVSSREFAIIFSDGTRITWWDVPDRPAEEALRRAWDDSRDRLRRWENICLTAASWSIVADVLRDTDVPEKVALSDRIRQLLAESGARPGVDMPLFDSVRELAWVHEVIGEHALLLIL